MGWDKEVEKEKMIWFHRDLPAWGGRCREDFHGCLAAHEPAAHDVLTTKQSKHTLCICVDKDYESSSMGQRTELMTGVNITVKDWKHIQTCFVSQFQVLTIRTTPKSGFSDFSGFSTDCMAPYVTKLFVWRHTLYVPKYWVIYTLHPREVLAHGNEFHKLSAHQR